MGFFPSPAGAVEWSGKCVGITDGDTITVLRGREQIKIRVYGVDTPEPGQDFGSRATKFTRDMVHGKTVTVQEVEKDRRDRTVALVDVAGASLSRELVANGYAWVYLEYCKIAACEDWKKLEAEARRKKLGLWAHPNPVPPWEWRQKQRENAPQKPHSGSYRGNTSSKKFHRDTCTSAKCKNCTEQFATREQAIAAGYKPCGSCRP